MSHFSSHYFESDVFGKANATEGIHREQIEPTLSIFRLVGQTSETIKSAYGDLDSSVIDKQIEADFPRWFQEYDNEVDGEEVDLPFVPENISINEEMEVESDNDELDVSEDEEEHDEEEEEEEDEEEEEEEDDDDDDDEDDENEDDEDEWEI
ncbi:hypothetical protein RIF29_28480 [Crotalaria pallida]|uniref:Uncharacterized protein n=1 Tax=Crotalaria pallida TaxID=3830 RepID=A0AAN9EJG0_CROPI